MLDRFGLRQAIGLQWSSGMNSASLRRTYLRSSRSRSTRYLMSFILKGWLQEEGQPSFDGCTPYSYLLKHKMWEMRFCRGGEKRIGSRNSGRCPGRGMRAQKGLLQAQPRCEQGSALPTALTVLWISMEMTSIGIWSAYPINGGRIEGNRIPSAGHLAPLIQPCLIWTA